MIRESDNNNKLYYCYKVTKKKNYQLLKISDNEKYENSKINVYENNNH